ncbi:RapZ C-terminal domain-containing protein [Streptomyces cacaoi]|uniref:RapZ C-terminal domain-containing protein n=1 Tax=Streptomyces cacaoi TaxID=1898 RepID=UPI00331A337B
MVAAVEIVSFGYLHAEPPTAHLTIDLRHHFRDPHVRPELRYMTADDAPVRAAVLNTPGITDLLVATVTAVRAFASGPNAGAITVADGCAGGRHRAPVFARVLAELLQAAGHSVTVCHRDLDKPVVQR